jgi:hypothetical protein
MARSGQSITRRAIPKPCLLEWVNDLPSGKPRLIERAEGIGYTVVNGESFFAQGEHQGGYAGQVLRSGAA